MKDLIPYNSFDEVPTREELARIGRLCAIAREKVGDDPASLTEVDFQALKVAGHIGEEKAARALVAQRDTTRPASPVCAPFPAKILDIEDPTEFEHQATPVWRSWFSKNGDRVASVNVAAAVALFLTRQLNFFADAMHAKTSSATGGLTLSSDAAPSSNPRPATARATRVRRRASRTWTSGSRDSSRSPGCLSGRVSGRYAICRGLRRHAWRFYLGCEDFHVRTTWLQH